MIKIIATTVKNESGPGYQTEISLKLELPNWIERLFFAKTHIYLVGQTGPGSIHAIKELRDKFIVPGTTEKWTLKGSKEAVERAMAGEPVLIIPNSRIVPKTEYLTLKALREDKVKLEKDIRDIIE